MADLGALLGGIGDLLTGLAAVGAVIVAWSQGGKELAKWRDQKREDKTAEVAGEVMGAALRALDAITGGSSRMLTDEVRPAEATDNPSLDAERKETERLQLKTHLDVLWAAYQPAIQALYNAQDLAQTYLSTDAADLVGAIVSLLHQTRANQGVWTQAGVYANVRSHDVFERGLGMTPKTEAEALRKKVLEVLRPLAQHRPSEPKK